LKQANDQQQNVEAFLTEAQTNHFYPEQDCEQNSENNETGEITEIVMNEKDNG
jgi:hypothetical protein